VGDEVHGDPARAFDHLRGSREATQMLGDLLPLGGRLITVAASSRQQGRTRGRRGELAVAHARSCADVA
jgi:hypothetical protein